MSSTCHTRPTTTRLTVCGMNRRLRTTPLKREFALHQQREAEPDDIERGDER